MPVGEKHKNTPQIMAVACPKCGVKPRQRCLTPLGASYPNVAHMARIKAANKEVA